MKKLLLSLMAIACFSIAIAQQSTFRIQYNFSQFDIPGGMVQAPSAGNYIFSSAVVSGFSIPLGPKGGLTEVDHNGNHVRSTLYNNGAFTTSVEFTDVKNVTGGGYVVTGDANSQCLIAKIPATFGAPTWQFRYLPVSGASAYGSKIIQTSDGGFLVAGSANHVNNGVAMTDSSKMFAVKVDGSGTVLWSKVFFYSTAFDDDDYLNGVTETTDGYVFVGSATTSFNGSSHGVVIKTDVSGTVQWARQTGADDVQCVITDAGNNIVMAGLDNVSGYIYAWQAPNSGPTTSVAGIANTQYTATGLPVSVSGLTKTVDGHFAAFTSGFSFSAFTTIIVKANRGTGAVMFDRSYNSFISILPVGIQAADSGYLMNSLSADTSGGTGGYDFAVTKTDVNGNQGAGSTCPATTPTVVTATYNPGVNTFTPVAVGTGVRSSGGLTAVNSTPGVVINCRTIACTPPPTPTVTSSGNNICPGTQVTISASGGSNVTYRVYTQATNGTSIGTAPLNVTPSTTTTYYVEADDNSNPGCVSARGSVTVTVIQPPANVGAITGNTAPCVGSQTYSISAVSGATSYTWAVSGGGSITPSGTSATVIWTTAGGPYTITVTATNSCGSKTNTLSVNVLASVSGVTASSSPASPVCEGTNVTLQGGGSNVTTWAWTGPNGYTSAVQNPVRNNIQTNQAGTYTLTATNSCGSGSASVSIVVNQVPQSVSASANPNPACAGNTVQLTGSATGATSWSWSGPNTFTASTQNASVVNAQSNATGTYTLTATNTCGNATGTVNVTVNDIPLSVTATANPTAVCPGGSLSLSGSATGATSYSWTGPNGFTSTQLNNTVPNFQAANAGTYTLTATNTCGSAQASAPVTISAGPAGTTATANLTNICSAASLNFTGTSTGATSWSWTGPNGFTSTQQNPSKPVVTLADSGLYTLTATNICGTQTATVNVDVDTVIQNLSVNATPNDTLCAGGTINLVGSGTQVNTWSWSGPNGYTSSQQSPSIPNATTSHSGTYTLTATNACGTSTATISVLVNNALSNITASVTSGAVVCNNTTINLSAAGANANNWSWTGPNGFTSTQQNPSISNATVAASGTYTVTADNACGSQSASVTVQVDTLIQNMSASASPNDTICAGAATTVTLSGSGTNVNSWSWSGPNGYTSTQQSPVISAASSSNSGVYSLTATNACGTATATVNLLVNDPIQGLSASVTTGSVVCNGTNINLTGSGTNVNSWNWTGPNGFTSTLQNPSISNATVAAGGTYTLSTDNACGTQTATVSVQVDTLIENLTTNASPNDTLCAGANVNLSATGTNVNSWGWTGPGGYSSSQQSPTISSATASATGDYIVTATNACGTASDTIHIQVNEAPIQPGTIVGTATPCGSDTASYSITGIPNADTYTWTISGSSGTITSGQGTTGISVNWGSTSGSFTVSVVAGNSCGTSTASTLNVNLQAPAPVMNSVITGDTGVCPGLQPYSIGNIPNATSYTWSVSGGGTIANGQGTTSINVDWTTAGTYTVSVVATNACGNSSAATLDVNVHPSPTPPTVSLQSNDTTICEGTTVVITATNSTGGTVSYNFYDAATGGNLVGTSPLTVSPVTTTVYYLEVINQFGCTGSAGRIPVTVNVNGAPTVLGITAGSDSVCYETETTLTANVTPSGTTVTWWDAATGGTQVGSGTTFTTGPVTQTTTWYAQASSSSGCQTLQGRVGSSVTVIPLPVVELISDKDHNTIFPNEVINFTAIPDSLNNYEFFWNGTSVQTGSSNAWSSSKIQDMDSVWVVATNLGCVGARDLDTVRVVDFPNAFTPNSDGVNDVFLKDYELIITNRWGQTLYEGREGWDGKYKGDKVSPGTYYYVVTLDNITDRKNAIKGTVLLIED